MTRFSGRDRWFIVLFGLIYMFNFIDRMIIAVVGEPIRREFGLGDLQLGVMGGVAFALFYGGIGIPLARLAERTSRVGIVVVATALWSVMTTLSGFAGSYGASKAALIQLNRMVATQYGKQRVRSNCVVIGFVLTPVL